MNLCAEYNKGDGPAGDLGRMGVSGLGSRDGLNRRPSMDSVSSASLRVAQRHRESQEENLKEDSSSTESAQQDGRTLPALLNGQNGQVRLFFLIYISCCIIGLCVFTISKVCIYLLVKNVVLLHYYLKL